MENSIIEDFQNLHVLAAYDLAIMDDLVRDFTAALDESSSRVPRSCRGAGETGHESVTRRRRRYKKRKAMTVCSLLHGGNMSEASESGLDEAFKDYIENITRQSDSDDFLVNSHKIPTGVETFPNVVAMVPQLVESDSVTENATPLRAPRRRRHFKRMAVDPRPDMDSLDTTSTFVEMDGASKRHHRRPKAEGTVAEETGWSYAYSLSGKRKRSAKDKSDNNSFDFDLNDDLHLDINSHMISGNISSISSNDDSDSENSSGDGQDGDDEESDAYHESESKGCIRLSNGEEEASENASDDELEKMQINEYDTNLKRMFAAGLQLMSPTTRNNFRARMKTLNQRKITAGRRRIKDRHPMYSLSCFLQERQKWVPGGTPWQPSFVAGAGAIVQDGTTKRHRKMPPIDAAFDMLTDHGELIQDHSRHLTNAAGGGSCLHSAQKSLRCKNSHAPSSTSSQHFVS